VARRANREYLLGLELHGLDGYVALDWRFRDCHLAIDDILTRIHQRLLDRARSELHRAMLVRFGKLAIGAGSITWHDKPLSHPNVASIELVDESPVVLRVIARDHPRPFERTSIFEIPNVGVALQLARELGYATNADVLRAAFAKTLRNTLFLDLLS
jgi:hypothetical protein